MSAAKAIQLVTYLNGTSIVAHHKKDQDVNKYVADVMKQHYKLSPACLSEPINDNQNNIPILALEEATRSDDVIAVVNLSTCKLLKDKMKLKGNVANSDTMWIITLHEWKVIGFVILGMNMPMKNLYLLQGDELKDLSEKMKAGQFTKLAEAALIESKVHSDLSNSSTASSSTSSGGGGVGNSSSGGDDFPSPSTNPTSTNSASETAENGALALSVVEIQSLFQYSSSLEHNIEEFKSFLVAISRSIQGSGPGLQAAPNDTLTAIDEKINEIDLFLNSLDADSRLSSRMDYVPFAFGKDQQKCKSFSSCLENVNHVKAMRYKFQQFLSKSPTELTSQKIRIATSIEGIDIQNMAPFQEFVGVGEKILLSNNFDKQSGTALVGFQPRQLILTNKPCLYYIDMTKNERKGTIEWLKDSTPFASIEHNSDGRSLGSFSIAAATPDGELRSFLFKVNSHDAGANLDAWISGINAYSSHVAIAVESPSKKHSGFFKSVKHILGFGEKKEHSSSNLTSELNSEANGSSPSNTRLARSDTEDSESYEDAKVQLDNLNNVLRRKGMLVQAFPLDISTDKPANVASKSDISSTSTGVETPSNEGGFFNSVEALFGLDKMEDHSDLSGRKERADEYTSVKFMQSSPGKDATLDNSQRVGVTSSNASSVGMPKKSLMSSLFGGGDENVEADENNNNSNDNNNNNNDNDNINDKNSNSHSSKSRSSSPSFAMKLNKSEFSMSDLICSKSPTGSRSNSPSDLRQGVNGSSRLQGPSSSSSSRLVPSPLASSASREIYSFAERYYLPFLITYLGIPNRINKASITPKFLNDNIMQTQPVFMKRYYSNSDLLHVASNPPKLSFPDDDGSSQEEYAISSEGNRYLKTIRINNTEEFVNFHIKSMSLLLWSLIQAYSVSDKLFSDQIKLINVSKILKESGISSISYCDLTIAFQKLNMKAAKHSSRKEDKISGSGTANLLTISYQLFQSILTVIYSKNKVPPSAERLIEDEYALRQLLNARNAHYIDLINSSKICWSGVLIGTHYTFYICRNNAGVLNTDAVVTSGAGAGIDLEYYSNQYIFEQETIYSSLADRKKIHFGKAEVQAAKTLWEKNVDQIRSIYNYYAKTICTRKCLSGSGVVGSNSNVANMSFLMSLDNLKSFLGDFGILPILIDIPTLIRVFQAVKLWEWELADAFLNQVYNTSSNPAAPIKSNPNPSHRKAMSLQEAELLASAPDISDYDLDYDDYLGFTRSHGNLCITLSGFLEFLTRLAALNGELGNTPKICVSTLLHYMDENDGKHLMVKRDRGSRAVNRKFLYK